MIYECWMPLHSFISPQSASKYTSYFLTQSALCIFTFTSLVCVSSLVCGWLNPWMQNPRYRGPTVNRKYENDAVPLIDSTFSQRAKPIRSLQLCGERTSIQPGDPIIDHPLIEWLLFISVADGIFYDTT